MIFSDFGRTGWARVQIPLPPLLCIASEVIRPRNQGVFCTVGAGMGWMNALRDRILNCAYSSSISRRWGKRECRYRSRSTSPCHTLVGRSQ